MAKSVLICDDARLWEWWLGYLDQERIQYCGEAENGIKAVDKYLETKPDLVMMDITMPEMDGIKH